MTTPEKFLQLFTSKLGSQRTAGDENCTASESALSCFLSPHDSKSKCTIPSLRLDNVLGTEASAKQLKSRLQFRRGLSPLVPAMILRSLSKSFAKLIDARLPSCLEMSLANSEGKFDVETANTVSLIASVKSPTEFTGAETSFQALPMAKGGFIKQNDKTTLVALPVIFRATIQVCVLGTKTVKVNMTTTGKIAGIFSPGYKQGLESVHLTLDTKALFHCMKTRCDQVVLSECLRTARELVTQQMPQRAPVLHPTRLEGPLSFNAPLPQPYPSVAGYPSTGVSVHASSSIGRLTPRTSMEFGQRTEV